VTARIEAPSSATRRRPWRRDGGGDPVAPSRLRAADLVATSLTGLRSRLVRSVLSALGVALGVAAVVCVLGITGASQAALLTQIDALGTNLLTATDAQAANGQPSLLPREAAPMAGRIDGVQAVSAVAGLRGVGVYRSDRVPASHTGALRVVATDPGLATTLRLRTRVGVFLNPATSRYPVVVLGAAAADSLGITELTDAPRIDVGGRMFSVVGILTPSPAQPALDRSAIIGMPVAADLFGYQGHPDELVVRTDVARTAAVARVLAASALPQQPQDVQVDQPTAALTARAAAAAAASRLLLGLGAVALAVGAVGIANTMVIAVLERRQEIGLRRALGATRTHIRRQFVAEATVLSTAGGLAGIVAGAVVTAATAQARGWPVALDVPGLLAGLALAFLTGPLAGLVPAARAAGVPPAQALRT
jgi:putative ABC transport system permease protein